MKRGFLYKYSTTNGLIDKLDGKMKRVHTFLDRKLNDRYVIFKPKQPELPPHIASYRLRADQTNTMYDLTSDGHLLVYLYRSSTAFVFNKRQWKIDQTVRYPDR